jgi:hypothetical protein
MNIHLHDTAPVTNAFLSGRYIAKMRKRPLGERLIIAEMMTGDSHTNKLNYTQAAALINVDARALATFANATSEQRHALFDGLTSLRQLRKANAKSRARTDADIIAFVNAVDPARVLEILDRMTAPAE